MSAFIASFELVRGFAHSSLGARIRRICWGEDSPIAIRGARIRPGLPSRMVAGRRHRGQRSALQQAARAPQWARDLLRFWTSRTTADLRAGVRTLLWLVSVLEAELHRREQEDNTVVDLELNTRFPARSTE